MEWDYEENYDTKTILGDDYRIEVNDRLGVVMIVDIDDPMVDWTNFNTGEE